MRLIDADAFARWLDKNHYIDKVTGKCDARQNKVLGIVISAVKNPEICPTVDAEPVRHGRWMENGEEYSFRVMRDRCSICGSTQGIDWMNFCPNCGAKMDGGSDDD